jgi:hypothetical protein
MLTPLTTVPMAEEIAKNKYYNGMNSIVQQTRPSIQETLSQPQLFGYTKRNDADDRFIQTVQQFATPLPSSSGFSNRSLQALVEEPKQTVVEQYAPPVTSSPNPGSEHEPHIPKPVISKTFISTDTITISKSTVIIVISVIVAVLLIEVWLRQIRIELMMLQQQTQRQPSFQQYQPQQPQQQTVTYT